MSTVTATMRKQASAMQKQIDHKLHPPIAQQNHTARRARIAAGMFEEGVRMETIQTVLYRLADLIDAKQVPPPLRGIESKAAVTEILFDPIKLYSDEFVAKMFQARHLQLLNLADTQKYETARRRMELYAKGQALIGVVSGYFPTPMKVAKEMIDWLGIVPDVVCDPSAGGGAILDAVKEYCPGVETVGFELDHTLASLCQEKGHNVVCADIMSTCTGTYEAILCNPPFENDQDCEHVMYYFDNLLAAGGRMVAITSSGAFSHSTKIAREFQAFVEEFGVWEDLPAGSFRESKTGVNTCIVRLEKPGC